MVAIEVPCDTQEHMKGQNLTNGPQYYAMTNNLLSIEALWVFDQKSQENGNTTVNNYKLVMQGLKNHFLPLKEIKL